MKRILKGWSIFRIIRLIIGVIIVIVAVQIQMLMIGIMGAMVIVQAIVNTTCCDTGTCNVKQRQ